MPNSGRGPGRPRYPDRLTPAEWTVLHLLRHGMTNSAIATVRHTSTDAVKYHLRNIVVKLGVRGRHALRHWSGVPARSALARQRGGGQMMSSKVPGITAVGQISIHVRDTARAEAFYRDVLDLRHLFTFGTLAFFDVDGVRLFISEPEDGAWRPTSVVYFRVPDIVAAHEALEARGVTFESAPHLIHRHESGLEEWMAFFRDLDENMLALMSQVPPGPATSA